jgi:hypothetical protein
MACVDAPKVKIPHPEATLLRLWDEAGKMVLDLTGPKRLKLFQKFADGAGAELDPTAILPIFCVFIEDSFRSFMKLNDSDREAWLNEARSSGAEVIHFADTLQELRRRRFGPGATGRWSQARQASGQNS